MSLKTISKSNRKDSISIGGVEFTIEYVKGLKDHEEDLQGDTNVDLRRIRISTDYSPDRQAQTLLHECMHAALYISGQSENLSEAHEEGLVLALDHLIWPLLPKILGKVNIDE